MDPIQTVEKRVKLKPLYDRVLVRVHPRGKTPGGLLLPEGYEDETPKGTVVAVGQGVPAGEKFRAPVVKEGDVVLLNGRGLEVKQGSEKLYLFQERDLAAVEESYEVEVKLISQ